MTSFTIRSRTPGSPRRARCHLSPFRPGSEIDRRRRRNTAMVPARCCRRLMSTDAPAATVDLSALQGVLPSTRSHPLWANWKMYSVFDTMSGESCPRPQPLLGRPFRGLFPRSPATRTTRCSREDLAMLRRDMPFARAREVLEEQRKSNVEARRWKKPWQFWKR
jgi:hypothetical protein